MKYCKNCGEILEENVKFCGKCGAHANNEQVDLEVARAKKKYSIRKILFVLITLCIVIGVAVYGISREMFMEQGKSKQVDIKVKSDSEEVEQEGQEQVIQVYKLRSSKRYSETGRLITCEEYDENGNITLIEEYDSKGQLNSREEYIRDEKGNITHHMHDAIEFTKEISYTYSYTEEEGRLSAICYKDGYWWRYTEYEYDDNDNLLVMIDYDQEGNVEYKEEYSYNKNGDELKVQFSNEDGVWFSAEYEYDDNGREIRGEFVVNGEISYEECTYNTEGELISKGIYNENGSLVESIIYEYDENGNRICEKKYDSEGKPKDWYEYKYVLSKDNVTE